MWIKRSRPGADDTSSVHYCVTYFSIQHGTAQYEDTRTTIDLTPASQPIYRAGEETLHPQYHRYLVTGLSPGL